jgi:hypothetical protein
MNDNNESEKGLLGYYPEMREAKPVAELEASLSHYGRHYFVKTRLELRGVGIKFLKTLTAADLVPQAQAKVGTHEYKVTEKAFEKLLKAHGVAYQMLL